MNVTELARLLKVTPNFLLQKLPEMGFHIGFKAIKVDNQIAKRIMKEWPAYMRRLERQEAMKRTQAAVVEQNAAMKKQVKIPKFITVRDFAALTEIPVNKILAELMKSGIFTSLNEKIDFDTASIIGADLAVEVILSEDQAGEEDQSARVKDILAKEEESCLVKRPPVIVVMGHVDHGKTKLLDAIRSTNVIATEAGGITQHIGAYQVERQGRLISFIDTPGHEAFTAMRNRGAKVADIAILVVAADDGVKPQTVEAYRIIEAAKIPFVVAINKIDKPEADINKVKQELANQLNLTPEDWGGSTICVPVSAKDGTGITEILDTILLVADLAEENFKANPCAAAMGTVVESKVDKGEGVVATVLVQNGTLRVGDELSCDGISYGKVRALKNYLNQTLDEAGPSLPARVIGFKIAPTVGDVIEVGSGEKIKSRKFKTNIDSTVNQVAEDNSNQDGHIVLLIKGDTLGSVEAIEGSLSKIDTQGVKIKIVSKGLGNITEGDVERAEANHAQIFGFSVKAAPGAEEAARTKGVNLKIYKIIYELLADIKAQIQELVKPDIKRVDLGRVKVLAIFRTDKKEQIVGVKVLSGSLEQNVMLEVLDGDDVRETGQLTGLKVGKEEVDRAEAGTECGIKFAGRPVLQIGDQINVYKEEKIYKKIS